MGVLHHRRRASCMQLSHLRAFNSAGVKADSSCTLDSRGGFKSEAGRLNLELSASAATYSAWLHSFFVCLFCFLHKQTAVLWKADKS